MIRLGARAVCPVRFIWLFIIFINAKSNSSITATLSFGILKLEFAVLPRFACKAGLFQISVWGYWSELRPEGSAGKRKILSYLETGEVINEAQASNKQRHGALFLAFTLSPPEILYKSTNTIWHIESSQHFCFIKTAKLLFLQMLNRCSWWRCTADRWGIMWTASVWLQDMWHFPVQSLNTNLSLNSLGFMHQYCIMTLNVRPFSVSWGRPSAERRHQCR